MISPPHDPKIKSRPPLGPLCKGFFLPGVRKSSLRILAVASTRGISKMKAPAELVFDEIVDLSGPKGRAYACHLAKTLFPDSRTL
jgi:hypothetical protein